MNNELIDSLIPILEKACLHSLSVTISRTDKNNIQIIDYGFSCQTIDNISIIAKNNNLLFFVMGVNNKIHLVIFQP